MAFGEELLPDLCLQNFIKNRTDAAELWKQHIFSGGHLNSGLFQHNRLVAVIDTDIANGSWTFAEFAPEECEDALRPSSRRPWSVWCRKLYPARSTNRCVEFES
uniref:(northern house mosquito) hypothetical protein n=1 Tax=Culex pipiens TaxID=7175 RepID=A0A8D8GY30_CULPI